MGIKLELAIFAKKDTTEKVLVPMPPDAGSDVQLALNKQFGGKWLRVDRLAGDGEMIKFNDDKKYEGFHPDIERYSSAIVKLEL